MSRVTRESLAVTAYDRGVEEGRKQRQKPAEDKKPAKSKPSRARQAVTKPVKAGVQQAIAEVQRPVQQSVRSGVSLLILTLGIIALYQFLTNAETVNSGIQGLQKGLAWLVDPSKSIGYVA
jgi:hypothetical protein